MIKKLTVIEKRASEHIVGEEYKYVYYVKNDSDFQFAISDIYGHLDEEKTDYYEQELNDIHALKNGEYYLECGDFNVTVIIEDIVFINRFKYI